MQNGRVTPELQGIVEITIASPSDSNAKLSFDAVVDTGFSEFLTIPSFVVPALNLAMIDVTNIILADGSIVEAPVVEASVLWHGDKWIDIDCAVMEGGPLVGMSLLYGSRLTLDVIDGGSVSIAPLA